MSTIEMSRDKFLDLRREFMPNVLIPPAACDGLYSYAVDFYNDGELLALGIPKDSNCESPSFQIAHVLPGENEVTIDNQEIETQKVINYKFERKGIIKSTYQCAIDLRVRSNLETWNANNKDSFLCLISKKLREVASVSLSKDYTGIINANYFSEYFANLSNLVQFCTPENVDELGNRAIFGNRH